MEVSNLPIDLNDVEGLTHLLKGRLITPTRFNLDVPLKAAANSIYSSFKVLVEMRGGEMSMDEYTRNHISSAAQWLIDPSGKPSLLLLGSVGNGKTTLAKAIARLIEFLTEKELGYSKRKNVRFITAKDVCKLCVASERYKDMRDDYDDLFREEMLIIDELGEEPVEVMVFGMVYTPLIDLLAHRYANQLFTIITTNLNKDGLMEKYNERIYDRLKEMATIIPFTNDSYRK